MRWKYEPVHGGLLYIYLAEGQVNGTLRLDENTAVDVRADGLVLGIEVLDGEERLPHLKDYPRGTVEVGTEPLLAFTIVRNDEATRRRLLALVEHVLALLRGLTTPVAEIVPGG